MDNLFTKATEKLAGLGLSTGEVEVYLALLEKSPQTGYEAAKRCNLSRGGIYSTLERLVEKGAVQKTLENKYIALDLPQFIKMRLDYFSDCADYLKDNFKYPDSKEKSEAVFSVFGHGTILNRVKEMIAGARKEICLVAFEEELSELKELLAQALDRHINLYLMSFGSFKLNGVDVVSRSTESLILKKLSGRFMTAVKDLEEGLLGAVDNTETCLASWSKNAHFCMNIKFYIAHEITLVKIFRLLDEKTIAGINSELRDPLTKVILDGMSGSHG